MYVGIIGCGAIGSEICRALDKGIEGIVLEAISDKNPQLAYSLKDELKCKPEVASLQEMLELVDLVVESASQEAVREIAPTVLEKGKDLMILSVGALVDTTFLDRLKGLARKNRSKIYIPSGAILGVDGIQAALISGINSVTLTTRKPPQSLREAIFVKKHGLEIEGRGKQVVFEGPAEEAVQGFPTNVNVAATLSLAGLGFKKTKVKIIADPTLATNIHEIDAEGNFGAFHIRVENQPCPRNPKTSYLAALSAIATLKRIANPLQIGT